MLVVFGKVNNLKLFASLFLFVATSPIAALGMGKIHLFSYINEPLSAEIELLGIDNIDYQSLLVELGSEQDFRNSGVARHYFLTRVNFDVVHFNDRTVINLSTKEVVRTPFLDFLLSLSWPDGKMIKGYTLLLDPPPENIDSIERPISLAMQMSSRSSKQLKMAQKPISEDNLQSQNTSSEPTSPSLPKVASQTNEVSASNEPEPIVYDRKALEKKLAEIRARQNETADELFDTEKAPAPALKPKANPKPVQPESNKLSLREKFQQADKANTQERQAIKRQLPPIVLFDKPINPLPLIMGVAALVILGLMVLVYKFAPNFPVLAKYRNRMDILIAKIYPKWGIKDDDESDEDESRYVPDELTDAFDLLTTNSADLAQKVELARGYLEVGDEESAKEILLQVIEDGNDDNKAAAEELLAEIK